MKIHIKQLQILLLTISYGVLSISGTDATFFNGSIASNIVTPSSDSIIFQNDIDESSDVHALIEEHLALGTSITISPTSNTKVSIGEALIFFSHHFDEIIPESYKYTEVLFLGLQKGSDEYIAVQKLIYAGVLPNRAVDLKEESIMSAFNFYSFAEHFFGLEIMSPEQKKSFKAKSATTQDMKHVNVMFEKKYTQNTAADLGLETVSVDDSFELQEKQRIFNDVYDTLLSSHFDRDDITDVDLIEAATVGLTNGTGDQFTTYFPPVENKDFMDSLSSDFEGIGSYVEMKQAGEFIIVSPIAGSPSEKAGLKGGDRVLSVDGKEIEITHSLNEIVSWIKGPKGTAVNLEILRNGDILEITVVRDTIVIENVEYKKLDSKTYYIKLVTFGENISFDFRKALEELNKQSGVKKVIIDLRNNPGGYLGEVSDMLGHFVPKGLPTVVVRYVDDGQQYTSPGYDLVDFTDYELIILQNSGSASASEIMAGTIKDYLPETIIMGEKSYGKGSVQTIKSYNDGSSLKYTIAKWFTGKTQTGIDKVGIPVDVEVEFDFEAFTETQVDNQLEAARKY